MKRNEVSQPPRNSLRRSWMSRHPLDLNYIRIPIEYFERFHGDRAHWAALRAQAAANADGFIFDHHRALSCHKFSRREMEQIAYLSFWRCCKLLTHVIGKFELAQRNKLQA